MQFVKGHGTRNDFVLIADPDDTRPLSDADVIALCDRRSGIGADGVLRAVRGRHVPTWTGDPDVWFMDYRNADGSVAEMCGNGVRVFAHYLRSRGFVDTDEFVVRTRAGDRAVVVGDWDEQDATVSVGMGPATVTGVSTARIGDLSLAGLGVDLGNPHLAAVIPGLTPERLAALDLVAPEFDEEFFPAGVNVEILTELVDDRVHMRVHERGVGETRSCGTGTVAAARAALADAGLTDGAVTVTVPGGEVTVTIAGEESTLTGPSRIIATGTVQI